MNEALTSPGAESAGANISSPGQGTSNNVRHAALDWLRVIAMFAIFIFHSGAPYTAGDWHISSQSKSFVLTIWNAWLIVWAMPLFTTLSGISMCLALRHYAAPRFVYERLRRLLIPLLFGIFVVVPPQVYLERLSRGQFDSSFLAFYPHYFNAPYLAIGGTGNFAWMGLHLWYLLMLLILTLIFLPIGLALDRRRQTPSAKRLQQWIERPAMIFLLALPIALLEWLLGNVGLGGWNMFAYPIFFAYGFFIMQSPTGVATIKQNAPTALMLAVISTLALLWSVYGKGPVPYGQYDPPQLAVLHAFAGWCWVLALLGLAYRSGDRRHPWLIGLNELLLPIYILHQTLIVIVAYHAEKTSLDSWEKYLIVLSLSAMLVTMICVAIPRFQITRLLFGMKSVEAKRKKT